LGLLIILTFAPAMSAATLTCVVLAICFVPAVVVTTPLLVPTAVLLTRVETSPQKAAGTSTNVEQKVTLLHVGGKVGAVKWDVAQYKNKDAAAAHNAKFAPLGSMLVGTKARGGTATAIANTGMFSKILGASVSAKMAGNTIKAIYTRNTMSATDKVTGAELILTSNLIPLLVAFSSSSLAPLSLPKLAVNLPPDIVRVKINSAPVTLSVALIDWGFFSSFIFPLLVSYDKVKLYDIPYEKDKIFLF
jgi:hypothetical protein